MTCNYCQEDKPKTHECLICKAEFCSADCLRRHLEFFNKEQERTRYKTEQK